MTQIVIEAHHYRGLKYARWMPAGVCALVGPNAAGKTTLLEVPSVVRALGRNPNEPDTVFEQSGGIHGLLHFGTPEGHSAR